MNISEKNLAKIKHTQYNKSMTHKEVTAVPIGISMQTVPTYRLSAFRRFLPGERHITRVESGDVLLLMLEGTLRFTEDGVPVELTRGEYYVQQRGDSTLSS